MMERLADEGWAAIAADLPGHGFSEGERGDIEDFSLYARAIEGLMLWAKTQGRYELPRPVILVGHSAGGAAVLSVAFDREPTEYPDAVVLLAPLIKPVQSWTIPFAAPLSLVLPWVKSRDGDDGYLGVRFMPLRWVAALGRWLGRIEKAAPLSLPTLVVQGMDDDVVEWRDNLRFLERKIPGAKVVLIPGVGHVLPVGGRARDASLAAIRSFLDGLYPDPEPPPAIVEAR
jgi:alpha-beta hydrolase superfamily lysophospholipase